MDAATKTLETLYTVRDEAGQAVKGFAAQDLGVALRDAEGKAVDPAAPTMGKQARKLMGITDEEARIAAWEKDMTKWEEQMKAWRGEVDKKAGKDAGPTLRAAWEKRIPPPQGPAPFVPNPTSAVQYARGINYLAGQKGRDAKKMAAALHMEAFGQAHNLKRVPGDALLVPTSKRMEILGEFLRALKKADDFHDGQVAPLQKAFEKRFRFQRKGDIPGENITNADFYEWLTSVVEHGDTAEIAGLKGLMAGSDSFQQAFQNSVLHKMLMDAGPNKGKAQFDGKLIGEYVG
jgi:hypothetical protein